MLLLGRLARAAALSGCGGGVLLVRGGGLGAPVDGTDILGQVAAEH